MGSRDLKNSTVKGKDEADEANPAFDADQGRKRISREAHSLFTAE